MIMRRKIKNFWGSFKNPKIKSIHWKNKLTLSSKDSSKDKFNTGISSNSYKIKSSNFCFMKI